MVNGISLAANESQACATMPVDNSPGSVTISALVTPKLFRRDGSSSMAPMPQTSELQVENSNVFMKPCTVFLVLGY